MSATEPRDRQPIRITLTASLILSALLAVLPAAVTWGVYKTRIENLEEGAKSQDAKAAQLAIEQQQLRELLGEVNTRLAVASAQNLDMIRRLGRIEDKFDMEHQR